MRYSFISAAVLAFVSAVSAADPTADFDPMTVPTKAGDTVAAGTAYTIKWTSIPKYNGTITLTLMEGSSTTTLALGDEIDSEIENSLNSYTWDIPADIQIFPVFGIQISYDPDPTIFQYSFPFKITKAATTGTSSSSVAGTTTTIKVSPNPSYTSTSSSTKVTSSSIAQNSTTLVSTSTSASITPSGNATLSRTATLTPTSSSSSVRSSGTAPPAATSSSAAMANMVQGSLAVIGGAVLALVL